MKTSDFNYYLPKELIAQHPLEDRTNSRLLKLNRENGNIEHDHFYNIIDELNSGDVLVINNTRVIPARIYGHRKDKEELIEFLLLNHKNDTWECLVKPGKKAKIGTEIIFSDKLKGEIVNISEDGNRFIKLEYEGIFENILDKLGEMPCHHILQKDLKIKIDIKQSIQNIMVLVFAPTAGLHFTKNF